MRGLQADGAAAIEQFVTSLANPSGEISLRFMGGLLTDPTQDAEGLLRGAVEATYEPKHVSTLDALVEVVRLTEQSYFEHSGRELESMIGLLYVDGGLLTELDPSPESYLLDMSPADRSAYADAISRARADFEKLLPALGRKEKADLTARCFSTILEDIDRINAER